MTPEVELPRRADAVVVSRPVLDTAWTRLLYCNTLTGIARDSNVGLAGEPRQEPEVRGSSASRAPRSGSVTTPMPSRALLPRERAGVAKFVLLAGFAAMQFALAAALLVPLKTDPVARAAMVASTGWSSPAASSDGTIATADALGERVRGAYASPECNPQAGIDEDCTFQ